MLLVASERRARDDRVLRQRREVDRRIVARGRRFGLEPRHGQQLVDEMRGAIDARVQFGEGAFARAASSVARSARSTCSLARRAACEARARRRR